MSDCVKEDWVSGMWIIISGVSCVAAGLVSLFVVGPLTKER